MIFCIYDKNAAYSVCGAGVLFMISLPIIRKNIYKRITTWRCLFLNKFWGMHIGEGTRISRKSFLDFANPKGIYIGEYSIITPGVRIFTHDHVNGGLKDTRIGSYCFVGANSLIMPGITIADHCVIAAGSVVTRDVPASSLVAGNPARIIRSGIETGRWGHLRRLPKASEIE